MGWLEGFCGGREIFSIFIILFFKLKGLKHKVSKLALNETYERYDMLNKSHPLSRYKANSGQKYIYIFDAFWPWS